MSHEYNESSKQNPSKKIRWKAFAKRLELACQNNPRCPTDEYRGKQKWLRDNLQTHFKVSVSPEGVRKWFVGETQPRRDVLAKVAQILEVDAAWLSLGISVDETPHEKRKRNAVADGVVNYLAGLIQLSGGNIAFPESDDSEESHPDFFAIIRGKQYVFTVKKFYPAANNIFKIRVPSRAENHIVLGVVATESPLKFDIVRLMPGVITKYAKGHSALVELEVSYDGLDYIVGDERLPKLTSFDQF